MIIMKIRRVSTLGVGGVDCEKEVIGCICVGRRGGEWVGGGPAEY